MIVYKGFVGTAVQRCVAYISRKPSFSILRRIYHPLRVIDEKRCTLKVDKHNASMYGGLRTVDASTHDP